MEHGQHDWEAESACDTLIKAEEIKKKPELYKKAMEVMKTRHKEIMSAMADMGMGKQMEREMGDSKMTRLQRRGMMPKGEKYADSYTHR